MDWQLTKTRILGTAAVVASAGADAAAKLIPSLARRGGVVSVFLDGNAVSVAVVRAQNRHSRVETSACIALEEDVFANPAAAGQAIAKVIQGVKRPPRALVVSIGAELTFERRVTLPAMTAEETDAAVLFQADRVLPFPAGEMRVDYIVESTGEDGVQSVVVSAITNETAELVETVAAAAGITLVGVFAGHSALYAAAGASDGVAGEGPRAVVCCRREGVEIAVGTTKVAAMSRFARNVASANIAGELRRTASAAGMELDKGAIVLAPRELSQALSWGTGLDVRPLETALESFAGSCGDGHAVAAAIAAGTLYVRGIALANFHASSASTRRKQWTSAFRGRTARYAITAAAAVAFFAFCLTGYWIYTLMLESEAAALASANSSLKAAVARAGTARPWLDGRTILLDVLAGVTSVFPDSPGSFVKSLSVAESGKISIQGKVPNPKAAYDLVAALSKVKGFQNVKLDSGAADASGGYTFAVSFEADNWRAGR